MFNLLDPTFFQRPTLELAQHLLGKLLVKHSDEGIASSWIVETEAYIGPDDRAAHSYGNRRTARTEIMFGPPGHAYTYSMHTHCLVNVVSGAEGAPEAILIRAVEPCEGIDIMQARRGRLRTAFELTNGPGKLTKALGITMEDYGLSLMKPPLLIAEGKKIDPSHIVSGPRIGIENTGEAKHYPWRFWIDGHPYVSRAPRKVKQGYF